MGEHLDEESMHDPSESSAMQVSSNGTQQKVKAIEDACKRLDFDALVELATSTGGLLTDELRRRAWPILLGCMNPVENELQGASRKAWETLPRHSDEDQVQLDVDRAFVYYPRDQSEQALKEKKKQLSDLIVSTLRKHPLLSYFQSYHDVVQVLLLVLGQNRAAQAVPRMSLFRLRDYMLPTIVPARKHFELVSAVVSIADPELANHIAEAENSFALSATHSLFAHDIQDYREIARLYDFLLAHEPVMSIYLFATITISRRSELLELESDESDILTYMIAKLPQNLDIDTLATNTVKLFQNHPPESLRGFLWWRLSSYSVLKTSRDIKTLQPLEDAEALGRKQIQQLRSEELMKRRILLLRKYRRPLTSLTAALLVGALSVYLRRTGQDQSFRAIFAWATRFLWRAE